MPCFATLLSVDAAIFWSPRFCSYVLPVRSQNTLTSIDTAFDLSSLQCHVTVLLLEDGQQHVLLRDRGRDLQLIVSDGNILRPSILHVNAISPPENVKQRSWALECVNRIWANESLPERLFPPEPRGDRLRFVLRALDGALDLATHKEIASALLGEDRVRQDWGDPGNHLRDRIRRAIKRGRALMSGDYLGLLE